MPEIELLLPKMGESVAEATIVKWVKNEGDTVEADEPIIEIATDKVDSEVPAPEDGILVKRLCAEGDVIAVGQPIALIRVGTDAGTAEKSAPSAPAHASGAKEESKFIAAPSSNGHAAQPAVHSSSTDKITKAGPSGRFYSPLVRNIAEGEGIAMAELEQIEGTGAEGRVTKKDLLNYLPGRGKDKAASNAGEPAKQASAPAQSQPPTPQAAPAIKAPSVSIGGQDELIEMDRMRKLIADHMVMSVQVSPHVTSYVEADVTNLVVWREKMKKKFMEREGEALTFTPIFMEAVIRALKDFPMVNVSTNGTHIIKRKDINLGMATALPTGNLIVPVIHQADQYNLTGLAKRVNDLAKRARENKLKPEEIQGGTYTITNVGTFGNVMGTPIINQPQAAILAIGAIRKKPAVIETPQGDFIGIRQMMFLSHSYDHRIVDGALGGSFVRKVADYLEAFDPNREL